MSLDSTKTQNSLTDYGQLYVVATPIGNRDDISLRAVDVLKSVDLIVCEDTRHSRRLCTYHDIRTPLQSLHAHNENQHSERYIQKLLAGQNLALISDAGTPLISDPGYPLVRQARARNITVTPVPGASALIALLSVSGLPTDHFEFSGFLPAKSQQRRDRLEQINRTTHTVVVYESAHRIAACLEDMQDIFENEREIVIGRELTKKFETIRSGSATELLSLLASDANQSKGEFVLAVSARTETENSELTDDVQQLIDLLLPLLPPKKVAKVIAGKYRLDTRQVYQHLISRS